MKLYLDPGHGGSDPGAVGNGLQEKEVALAIAKQIKDLLRDYSGVEVKMSRTADMTKSLVARTKEANSWKADIFLSIHCNAFNGKARGYEDFVYNGIRANSTSSKYQTILHATVAKGISLPNRGKKQANFHVLRESSMPAILTENGFIDHPEDAKLMKQTNWREQVAAGHVEGLVQIFQLKKAEQKQASFVVIAGSFQKRINAEGRVIFLEAKGIDAQIQQVRIAGNKMYRVQAGAFPKSEEAEKRLLRLVNAGVNGFILKN